MSDHAKITSSIRSLIGGPSNNSKRPNTNVPKFNFNSSGFSNKRQKIKTAKRLPFEITIFNPPKNGITNRVILEKDMKQLGVGNIVLFENSSAEDVKAELYKLLNTMTSDASSDIDIENISFTYLKREGRKKQFKKHLCSSSFVYNAIGLKDMTGRDSKSVYIVLSKSINLNSSEIQNLTTISTNVTNQDDVDSDKSFTDLEFSPPTYQMAGKKNSQIQRHSMVSSVDEAPSISNSVSQYLLWTIFLDLAFR